MQEINFKIQLDKTVKGSGLSYIAFFIEVENGLSDPTTGDKKCYPFY